MKEISGHYYFKNGLLHADKSFLPKFLLRGTNVYEVLRHSKGIALFLEEHIERLKNSATGKGLCLGAIIISDLRKQIKELALKTKQAEGNIKIVIHAENPSDCQIYVYPVEFFYPSDKDYLKGVKLLSLKESRPDPNLKNWRPEFRSRINEIKAESSVYEVLLINDDGLVTEGSQSNIFYIIDDHIITAKRENILPGITREYIFKICEEKRIPLFEKDFTLADLNKAHNVFLTGTSPKVLPVCQIDNQTFSPQDRILESLIYEYKLKIEEYIKKHS